MNQNNLLKPANHIWSTIVWELSKKANPSIKTKCSELDNIQIRNIQF